MKATKKALDALASALSKPCESDLCAPSGACDPCDDRASIAMTLAPSLAAVARAATDWREAIRSPQGERTAKQRRRYSHDVAVARGKVFAALDALEAAAKEATP